MHDASYTGSIVKMPVNGRIADDAHQGIGLFTG